MSKVKKITVSNLKAVSKLSADFNGCTAIITGGNNKGKSSFLKSLPERLRGIKPEIILKEGEKEGFAEWELTTGEKFVWQFDGKKEKLTFITEKNITTSITKGISSFYFPPIFDVDEFLNSTPKKQREVLQKLTGIDFTEIDRDYKEAYEARTYANKRFEEEKVKNKDLSYDGKLPFIITPVDDLVKELNSIESHNLIYDQKNELILSKQGVIDSNKAEIESLKNKISALEERNNVVLNEIVSIQEWQGVPGNKAKTNKKELEEKLSKIKEDNAIIEENNKARIQQEAFDKAQNNAKIADDEVKRIESEKADVIKNASMPDGFGFSDDGITYNGFAFNKETLSSSGIYIAALKLAAINLGEVKTLHFDASFLDKNSLQEIEVWAKENNLQLLIERPDFDGGEIEYQLIQQN